MYPETERIFQVLKSYNAYMPDDQKFWDRPFLWNSERQGKFNIWNLLVTENFVRSTNIDQAIKSWQAIESRGTITTQERFEYAPSWKEREDRVPPYVLKERANIYQALAYFIKQNLQNIEVYVLSDCESTDNNFEAYMILCQTSDLDWLCFLPSIPEADMQDYSSHTNVKALTSCRSEYLNTQVLFEKINKILARLKPINIYKYYECTYQHNILCTTSHNKIKAIRMGLEASKIFVVENSLLPMESYPGSEQVRQFMEEELQNCKCFTLNFWESLYEYQIGYLPTGDWLGFKHWFWAEYNP